uniref:Uncharacterized protein n=1 Tax=Arundo donax TaxID=35708 RepID=A0A0A8XUA5_ARUDO
MYIRYEGAYKFLIYIATVRKAKPHHLQF